VTVLENSIREHLNKIAPRVMAVLRPIKVVLTNYPEGQVEYLEAINNPEDPGAGSRKIPFTREFYIEEDDFREDAPSKYFRLKPGGEVRLRYAYIIKCEQVIKDPVTGAIKELHCTYDPQTRSGSDTSNRKVKGTIHWGPAAHALDAEVRVYDRLFSTEEPDAAAAGKTFLDYMNPHSLEVVQAKVEPCLVDATAGARYQFERLGYFCVDIKDSKPGKPVFNRTVTLRDTWAKLEARGDG
jgi:glutaminyl-tRNA synthetase